MSPRHGPPDVIDGKRGSRITAIGNCWRGADGCAPVDLLAAWNARFDPDLAPDAGWVPTLYGPAGSAEAAAGVRARVLRGAGPGR